MILLMFFCFYCGNRCDADPMVLADYIVVLVKSDHRSTDSLKEHCREKLSDFLLDETDSFLADLFKYLEGMSLLLFRRDPTTCCSF